MLTPVDIENKMFKKVKIGGYDINEVEDFLEELIVDYETLFKENSDLKEKLEKSNETADYYSTLEQGVSQTIENSHKAAEEIKENALKEAEEIKKAAKDNASCSVEEIKLEIKAKELELEKIKKEMQIYKIKVKSMLEAQLKIIDEEE